MRAVWLIATNYLREQRWAIILLLIWLVGSASLAAVGKFSADDALDFLKLQAGYGVAFSAFLAASAIHNERRSRRILAVLSKGIERGQYLAGLIAGVLLGAFLYCLFMGAFGSIMFRAVGLPLAALWYLLALVMVACALSATTAMLFATLVPPLVAIALTAITLGFGFGVAQTGLTRNLLPVGALMISLSRYDLHSGLSPQWDTLAWGVAQALVLWLLATRIFLRRDIAVAVE